jgi:simple sugar transport system permease protein
MAMSGAIAGVAGAVHAMGQEHRFNEGFSPGFGFDSLGVALLAGRNPIGVIPAALLFAFVDQGSVRAQVHDGLPKEVSAVIMGLIILLVAFGRWRRRTSE